MIFIGVAIVVTGVAASLAYAFGTYTKNAHCLEDARDQRKHELALNQTAAVESRMRSEASATNSFDVAVARITYHTRQVDYAERLLPLLTETTLIPDERRDDLIEAMKRQLRDQAPPVLEDPSYFEEGMRKL